MVDLHQFPSQHVKCAKLVLKANNQLYCGYMYFLEHFEDTEQQGMSSVQCMYSADFTSLDGAEGVRVTTRVSS